MIGSSSQYVSGSLRQLVKRGLVVRLGYHGASKYVAGDALHAPGSQL